MVVASDAVTADLEAEVRAAVGVMWSWPNVMRRIADGVLGIGRATNGDALDLSEAPARLQSDAQLGTAHLRRRRPAAPRAATPARAARRSATRTRAALPGRRRRRPVAAAGDHARRLQHGVAAGAQRPRRQLRTASLIARSLQTVDKCSRGPCGRSVRPPSGPRPRPNAVRPWRLSLRQRLPRLRSRGAMRTRASAGSAVLRRRAAIARLRAVARCPSAGGSSRSSGCTGGRA